MVAQEEEPKRLSVRSAVYPPLLVESFTNPSGCPRSGRSLGPTRRSFKLVLRAHRLTLSFGTGVGRIDR